MTGRKLVALSPRPAYLHPKVPGWVQIAAAVLTSLFFVTPGMIAFAGSLGSYVNARYGYSIKYPAPLLIPMPVSEDGDGRHFRSVDGHADALVWASENVLGQSPSDLATEAAKDCGGRAPAYRVVKAKLVALSCTTPKGKIFYSKTVIRGDMLTSMEITYPASEQTKWDQPIRVMAGSMRAAAP